MLALAAARLGFLPHHSSTRKPTAPPFRSPPRTIVAAYDDEALAASPARSHVVTYEFENVPAATAAFLALASPSFPPATRSQSRRTASPKSASSPASAFRSPPFAAVDNAGRLDVGARRIRRPAILKTRRLGYDGKGQR